jgi:predicted amidohydrolase
MKKGLPRIDDFDSGIFFWKSNRNSEHPILTEDTHLKIALVHFETRYAQPDDNRTKLLTENEKAARTGARIIVNPELCVSGYGFDSRTDIGPLVETVDGPTVQAMADVARDYGVYIALGMAERDPRTGLFYNTALLIDPRGRISAKHRKTKAESKWACPGPVRQNDLCDTPWGRVGLLICSESYFSLLPRTMALRGVNLLLLPAAWPAGHIDVRRLWRARAIENGFFMAGVNRCGQDRIMDCGHAYSCVFDPEGATVVSGTAASTQVLTADLPLTDGRLPGPADGGGLAGRSPERYHYLCADLRPTTDLTSYYGLPDPGVLSVDLVGRDLGDPERFAETVRSLTLIQSGHPRLIVLPRMAGADGVRERLADLARNADAAVLASLDRGPDGADLFLARPDDSDAAADAADPCRPPDGPPMIAVGPARVGLAHAKDFRHPELAAAMSRRGCDLAAVTGGRAGADPDVLSVKALEKLAVAAAHPAEALWAEPPSGHDHWSLRRVADGVLRATLDTRPTRRKSFLDRIDTDLLLEGVGGDDGGPS